MEDEPGGATRERRSVRTWLFNPFHYVAGWLALAVGLVVMLVAGAMAAAAGGRFDGALDFHQLPPGVESPPWLFLVDALAAWLPLSVLLYLGGRLIGRSRVRAIDVFGTQALARFPTLVSAALSLPPGVRRYQEHLLSQLADVLRQFGYVLEQRVPNTAPVQVGPLDGLAFFACVLGVLVMLVWMVALMYRAFSVSCNVRGGKVIGVFIGALVLAEAISKVIVIAAGAL